MVYKNKKPISGSDHICLVPFIAGIPYAVIANVFERNTVQEAYSNQNNIQTDNRHQHRLTTRIESSHGKGYFESNVEVLIKNKLKTVGTSFHTYRYRSQERCMNVAFGIDVIML